MERARMRETSQMSSEVLAFTGRLLGWRRRSGGQRHECAKGEDSRKVGDKELEIQHHLWRPRCHNHNKHLQYYPQHLLAVHPYEAVAANGVSSFTVSAFAWFSCWIYLGSSLLKSDRYLPYWFLFVFFLQSSAMHGGTYGNAHDDSDGDAHVNTYCSAHNGIDFEQGPPTCQNRNRQYYETLI